MRFLILFFAYILMVHFAFAQGGPGPLPGLPGGAPYDVQMNAAGSFGAVPSRVPLSIMVTDGSGHPYWSNTLPTPIVAGSSTTYVGIPSVNTAGKSFMTCGYNTCGDGGQAIYVPGLILPRMATGAVCATNTECVTDGVTNTTTTITSATASFNTFDVGRPISDSAGDIPANDTIASVTGPNTAVLAVAATGSATNDTFTFGSVRSNSPGYILDNAGNPLSLAPQALNPLMFGALPYVTGSTPDSHAALQSFFDALVLTEWPSTGQGNFYSSTNLAVALTHINKFSFIAPDQSLVINFGPGLTAPLFLISYPGGTPGTGGGGGSPGHSSFHWQLEGVKFSGSVAGLLCQIGDPHNGDAPNDITLQIGCANTMASPIAIGCNLASIYNSIRIYFNCQVGAPHPGYTKVSDAVIASTNLLSSATWSASSPLTSSDVGNMVSVQLASSGVEYCPAGTTIASVTAGVATLSIPGSGVCINGTGLTAHIAGGVAVQISSADTNNFYGIAATAAVAIQWVSVAQNASYAGARNNVFHEIDFDGSPIIGFEDTGGYNFSNVVLSGNTSPLDYLACTITMPVGGSTSNKAYNPYVNPELTALGQSGACVYTPDDWFLDVPGLSLVHNTPSQTTWLPTTPVSTTIYTNTTGQRDQLFFSGVTQTSFKLNGGATSIYPSSVTEGSLVINSGATLQLTCSPCGTWVVVPVN